MRPDLYSFQEDTAEYHRWYEIGGRPRPEPLTREALTALLETIPHAGGSNAAIPSAEWERFKDRKLGALRAPIETLQELVQAHDHEGPWWEPARQAADWCGATEPPSLAAVHAALEGLLLRVEHFAHDGSSRPSWHEKAAAALDVTDALARKAGMAPGWLNLYEAYYILQEKHALYCRSLANGDSESARLWRYEAAQIERHFPALRALVDFDDEKRPMAAFADTCPEL